MQWQRWGRVWNEIVHSLRARDLLSDTERDEVRNAAIASMGAVRATSSQCGVSQAPQLYTQFTLLYPASLHTCSELSS